MRFQRAADSSVASHVYATDEAIGGLAEVEPGTGNVKALAQSRPMGIDVKNGQTYLNYVVPKEYGDANGFQAGSTFKAFVLSAAIEQDIPLNHAINAPASMVLNESDYEDCDHEPYGYGTWPVRNSTSSGTMNLYTGTRLSVNTFFAQLEQETGICQPFNLARKMGVRLTQPLPNKQRLRWRAHPLLHAGRRRREPPGDGRGLRNLRGPRTALRRASRDLDPGLEPQDAQEVPQGLPAGAAEPGRRRRQRRPARGAGERRFRCLRGAGPRQAVSREDGHHQRQQGRLVRGLHPAPRDRVDDRGRELCRTADHPHRADPGRVVHGLGPWLDDGRPDVGRRDARDPAVPALRRLRGSRPPRTSGVC